MTLFWCAMQQSYPNQLCSLFVVCFRSFPPTFVSRGGYWGRLTRNSRLGSPFFQRFRGYTLWEFCTEFFPGFFQPSTEFMLKWPNTWSQVGHNVKKGRVVNTAFKSFNTVATPPLELSWMRGSQAGSRLPKTFWTLFNFFAFCFFPVKNFIDNLRVLMLDDVVYIVL